VSERHYDNIDRAAGIAIILVVFGHMFFPVMMKTPWYAKAVEFVYKIHMPLFIFISGFIAFLSASKASVKNPSDYWKFIGRKAKKFMPAYLFFGFLAIAIELIFYNRSFQEITPYLKAMVLYPAKGSPTFIWYLYVLFWFYLITPWLVKLNKNVLWGIFALSYLLIFVPLPPYFSANLFGRYFFFFIGGGLLYLNYTSIIELIKKYGWIFILLFVAASVIDLTVHPLLLQLLSILFIPAILYLTSMNQGNAFYAFLSFAGQGSYAIYLLNSMILNFIYLIFYKTSIVFPASLFVATGLVLGVAVPLGIRHVFNKVVPKSIYVL
jgi:peptidoglycan/LPS O-acetylase OafA/YrhL